MSEIGEVFLAKARESLEGTASELANGRHNNAANRSYYASFQAAIAALDLAGIHPPGARRSGGMGSSKASSSACSSTGVSSIPSRCAML